MVFFKQLLRSVRTVLKSLFFLQYMPAALWYSLKRDRANRQDLPPLSSNTVMRPGQLRQIRATERGAHFYFNHADLEIDFLAANFVRMTWSPGHLPVPYAIACDQWDSVAVHLDEAENGWCLTSEALKVEVSSDGSLLFYDGAGRCLRTEQPPQRQGEGWGHRVNLCPEERIYGLGERSAALNLRTVQAESQATKTYGMWNYDPGNIYRPGTDPMYICIPVYIGLHDRGSYLAFYENTFRGEFTVTCQKSEHHFADIAFAGGTLRYYIAIGSPSQLIERYTRLTGRAPLPSRWALGYHQSRWGFRTASTVQAEVEQFQAHDLPLSALHLDIDCQVNSRSFTIDPKRFPQLRQFTQQLAKSGVRLIAINNPGIRYSRQSNLFLEGQVLEAFCTYPNGDLVVAPVWAGRTVFPDFTDPQVRAWWSQQFAYLLDVGIAGFWNDMNEPAAFVSWGDPTLPEVAQHSLEGRGGDHREAHNVYGLLETKAAYDSLRQYRPQQRPFVVSRSGWAGLQRYAWTWTGDIVSTWAALRQTLSTVIGLGLSGIPYSGPDIGGFLGNPSAELYLRWFQLSTFLAFYRTHCATSAMPRAPWTYGEPYLSIIRRFLQLRYQLMPYLYTLAWEAAERGYPLVRPLFWHAGQGRSHWDTEDAFYLGDALLVCPVFHEAARERAIALPAGQWYDFWTDEVLMGEQTVQRAAPLEQIPVLVKAGTVLPMEDQQQLILHIYPPKVENERESVLYSDAGEGYGKSRTDRFQLIRQGCELKLLWTRQGDYPFPYARIQLQMHGITPQQVWVDGQEIALQDSSLSCQPFQQARFSGII
ncbi:glycoside hydrolase family 31 protein [Romeria aff. gracilis LEGE 07310]|uniref:Glycoside hydrolase family 31 protein n=1 Tax=Vasconcelosia minhoensis LEGE 07310 TaxID=915328 RepID=A0A8J7DDC1_9CYAN|nr:glycoside hydrolase family 31 protein [Romeria gracilis]MBE9078608.1 glycoside hydrolase family 31 protein [Romeria aff. gracilis LEGE 07310]